MVIFRARLTPTECQHLAETSPSTVKLISRRRVSGKCQTWNRAVAHALFPYAAAASSRIPNIVSLRVSSRCVEQPPGTDTVNRDHEKRNDVILAFPANSEVSVTTIRHGNSIRGTQFCMRTKARTNRVWCFHRCALRASELRTSSADFPLGHRFMYTEARAKCFSWKRSVVQKREGPKNMIQIK